MLIPTEGKTAFTYEIGIEMLEALYSLPEKELSRDLHTVMGLMLQCTPLSPLDLWKFFHKFLDLHYKELSFLVRAMINLDDRFLAPLGIDYEEKPVRTVRGKKVTASYRDLSKAATPDTQTLNQFVQTTIIKSR